MQSNRLVVTLDRENNMSIGYRQGIQTVYLNSYLTKEFIVCPKAPLYTGETMWVTFYQEGATPLEAIMLTPRKTTKANSTIQVVGDNLDSIEQSQQQEYEYYMQLPQAVLRNAGKWQFSLAIVVLYDNATDSVQYDSAAHKYTSSDAYDLVEQADTIAQAATSDIAGFMVNDSLAQVPGGAPNDKTIVDVYNGVIEAADAAAAYAKQAEEAAKNVIAGDHAPYIGENGNWYEYSTERQQYVDSGVPAQGPAGPSQDLSNYATKQDVATAIEAAITTALNTPV